MATSVAEQQRRRYIGIPSVQPGEMSWLEREDSNLVSPRLEVSTDFEVSRRP
jgi:hypothetical protein